MKWQELLWQRPGPKAQVQGKAERLFTTEGEAVMRFGTGVGLASGTFSGVEFESAVCSGVGSVGVGNEVLGVEGTGVEGTDLK